MNSPCQECIQGSIHKGKPQGKEEIIHGLNTYVVGNQTNPRGIIVVYSDIFGLALPNNKLIADAYSKSGEWLVYLPDFFKGDPVPLKAVDVLIPVDAKQQSTFAKYTGILALLPQYVMWTRRHKEHSTDEDCMNWCQALRRATPLNQKIGMAGFCWGGKYAIRAAKQSNTIEVDGRKVPLVDAVVALHPSHLALPEDVENLVVPVSYGWGLEDIGVKIEQKAMVEEFHAKATREGKSLPKMEHRVYKPGRHGFAIRGNPADPQEKACLEGSLTQALDWFAQWL